MEIHPLHPPGFLVWEFPNWFYQMVLMEFEPNMAEDGLRYKNVHDSGTYLPTGIALASTWNPALANEYGKVLGSEAKFRGKNIILGPGVNIMRSPLNGRNFEYMSEDPFLTSRMAVEYIKGVQSQGVSACVKHFAANNEETDRNTVDVQMSERALQEIYLPAFKASVMEAKVNGVMAAYNKFRGEFCTQNEYLLNNILKKDWGFKGILISDWGAVHGTKEALLHGTDLEMGTDLVLAGSTVAQSGVKKHLPPFMIDFILRIPRFYWLKMVQFRFR